MLAASRSQAWCSGFWRTGVFSSCHSPPAPFCCNTRCWAGLPPLPLLRRLGIRTTAEIHQEILALRILRGDFVEPARPTRRACSPWLASTDDLRFAGGSREVLDRSIFDGRAHGRVGARRFGGQSTGGFSSAAARAVAGRSVLLASCSASCVSTTMLMRRLIGAARIVLVEQHRGGEADHARDLLGGEPAASSARRAALARSVDRSQLV